jgi:hypothetical protein
LVAAITEPMRSNYVDKEVVFSIVGPTLRHHPRRCLESSDGLGHLSLEESVDPKRLHPQNWSFCYCRMHSCFEFRSLLRLSRFETDSYFSSAHSRNRPRLKGHYRSSYLVQLNDAKREPDSQTSQSFLREEPSQGWALLAVV